MSIATAMSSTLIPIAIFMRMSMTRTMRARGKNRIIRTTRKAKADTGTKIALNPHSGSVTV